MRKVAFTGTSQGLTAEQRTALAVHLFAAPPGELHHGMCVGADAQAHILAKRYGWEVVGHPGLNSAGEAGGRAHGLLGLARVLPELPYLKRNRNIVADASVLYACPKGMNEPRSTRGSGTWTTVKYARQAGVPVVIFWPDGSVTAE